jgi:hypothetical protein
LPPINAKHRQLASALCPWQRSRFSPLTFSELLGRIRAAGTPHSEALHVVERYRLIDGEAAAEIQRKHGAIPNRINTPYGRGVVDPDTTKKGLQVEFTVEDPAVFTTVWSGRITYRRLIGNWPEAVCAENPHLLGTDAAIPTAYTPDF